MSNFANKEELIAWLLKYHVYSVYMKQINSAWNGMKNHIGKSDEHRLDYFIEIYQKMSTGKFCLLVYRKIRPTPAVLDAGGHLRKADEYQPPAQVS